jgi:hypothetical protein
MDDREFQQQFAEETRRLRLNPYRLGGGLAVSSPDGGNSLLTRMRALEIGATWEDVFPGLQLADPEPHVAEAIASFDADPDAFWNDHDRHAFEAEFRRVVLPALRNSDSLREALRAVRGLPDGAGWEAFHRALRARLTG